jgi:hypothetical protein
MSFAAPIWLLSLLPWAALSVWLMLGRRQRVEVPFIELWQTTPRPLRELRASLRPPPFALACMLLAMLLGLLAEARPFLRFPLMAHITLIVDRGVTMTGKNAEATVLAAFDATRNELPMLTRVDLLQVPGNLKQTDAWDWWGLLSPATALDTRDSIRNAVQQSVGPTIVVTGNQIDSSDPRVVLFEVPPPSNVGIVHAAARQSPRPASKLPGASLSSSPLTSGTQILGQRTHGPLVTSSPPALMLVTIVVPRSRSKASIMRR